METTVRNRAIAPAGPRSSPPPFSGWTSAPNSEPITEVVRRCEIGKILLEAGLPEAALGQFEFALDLDAHAAEGWAGRGEALACLNRYEEALENLEQAQELAGLSDIAIWIQKATVLILLGRPVEALSCCEYVLMLRPDHTQAWLFRGVAQQRLGEFRAASESYSRATHYPRPSLHDQIRRFWHDLTTHQQAG